LLSAETRLNERPRFVSQVDSPAFQERTDDAEVDDDADGGRDEDEVDEEEEEEEEDQEEEEDDDDEQDVGWAPCFAEHDDEHDKEDDDAPASESPTTRAPESSPASHGAQRATACTRLWTSRRDRALPFS
jgi:hypothetical protein